MSENANAMKLPNAMKLQVLLEVEKRAMALVHVWDAEPIHFDTHLNIMIARLKAALVGAVDL